MINKDFPIDYLNSNEPNPSLLQLDYKSGVLVPKTIPKPPPFRVGPPGPIGPIGPPGPPCSRGLSEYSYIYNLGAQVVPVESAITFSHNGIISGNITHVAGSTSIFIGSPGDYYINFIVLGVKPNQFTVFQNGVPVVGSTYGSGDLNQINHGQVIIRAAAGDVITLNNYSSSRPVKLQLLAGGSRTIVNASFTIHKISD